MTFENVQAGLRTDYLFRLANQRKAFVLGTGDLSELALGWCTYGVGDHMSHYNVNGSVAKTLIQHLIRWVVKTSQFDEAASATLLSILDTEISPELVPADATRRAPEHPGQGRPVRAAGLQPLPHHALRPAALEGGVPGLARLAGRDPRRVAAGLSRAAQHAYDVGDIKKWLGVFLFRFFEISQFKRSALPNGPKVISGGELSPRGDWRAPSDGNARVWLDELERNVPG